MEIDKLIAGIPADVSQAMYRLSQAGFGVWLVGGVLRDHLLGFLPKDWDVATDASPQQVLALFPGRTVPIGIRHGTVQIRTNQRGIEVTSVQKRGRDGMIWDLGRRDFTVNAIALSFPEAELLDPYNGRNDLRNGVLRGVGIPRDRFREDPLRTLRAARFAGVYGFQIEDRTFEALKSEAFGLSGVAGERIREEIFKLLLGQYAIDAFEVMSRGRVLEAVLPELVECRDKQGEDHSPHDIYGHTLLTVNQCPLRLRVRLAALFHHLARCGVKGPEDDKPVSFQDATRGKPILASAIMERWRMSHKEIQEVSVLVENQLPNRPADWTDASLRRLVAGVGVEFIEDLLDLAHADRLSHVNSEAAIAELSGLKARIQRELLRNPPLRIKDLAVNGGDIMRILNIKPGPVVGETLKKLHIKVLDEPHLNDRETLINFIEVEYHGPARGGSL
ncbi:MAG: CCA tRNA nucleotidyltransferase [Syntrophobacteraceae bacterium]